MKIIQIRTTPLSGASTRVKEIITELCHGSEEGVTHLTRGIFPLEMLRDPKLEEIFFPQ